MTALEKWNELAKQYNAIPQVAAVETPTLDALERIKKLVFALQVELGSLGMPNELRREITLGQISEISRLGDV